MAITLDAIALPADLIWIDEYDYSPVKQSVGVAVDGSLIIEAAAQLKGRTITLQGADNAGWITRGTLDALRAKLYQPGLVMALVHNGNAYDVLFVQPDGITASPVLDFNAPAADDWYVVTLKLFEV